MDWTQFDKGIFLVNVLGIVYDPQAKLILIGKRENDPYLKELSWVFPGGRPTYEGELDDNLKTIIKDKTGLDTDVKEVVFAKTYPEKREFLSVYFCCVSSKQEVKAGNGFSEFKWVKPTEVQNYFTTSLHPKLLEYLKTLE